MSIEGEMAQESFMRMGGTFARVLAAKYKSGELVKPEYREYPKAVQINERWEEVDWSTETIKGGTLSGVTRQRVFDTVIVHSEEEEERVLSGGKTSAQVEDERQTLIMRCRALGMKVDPEWSTIRLRRELGDKLDAPEPVGVEAEMAALKEKLATLQEMANMRAEIDRLTAQLTRPTDAPSEAEGLRQELTALGVKVDQRWGVSRLREELDAATAPERAA